MKDLKENHNIAAAYNDNFFYDGHENVFAEIEKLS